MEKVLNKTKRSKTECSVTAKYHIEVPLHQVYSTRCIYKVSFGKTKRKYYIGKAKSFLQSCEMMAILIERGLRTQVVHEADMYYHVIRYLTKSRITTAYAEMIHDGDGQPESELLKVEQELLNKCKDDVDCLNNSFDAYIPKWIPADQVKIFNKWKDDTNKSNDTKNTGSKPRKKH